VDVIRVSHRMVMVVIEVVVIHVLFSVLLLMVTLS